MNPNMLFTGDVSGVFELLLMFLLLAAVIGLLALIIFAVYLGAWAVTYVLRGLALTKMLKSIGYRHPSYAWIPFLCFKSFGDLADMYDSGKPRQGYGKKLLVLNVIFFVLAELMSIVGAIISICTGAFNFIPTAQPDITWLVLLVFIPIAIASLAVAVIYQIYYYKALWRILRIFCPDMSLIFLLISLIAGGQIEVFFLFAFCKNEPKNLRTGALN